MVRVLATPPPALTAVERPPSLKGEELITALMAADDASGLEDGDDGGEAGRGRLSHLHSISEHHQRDKSSPKGAALKEKQRRHTCGPTLLQSGSVPVAEKLDW